MSFKMTYSGNGSGSRAGKTYEGDTGLIQSQLDMLTDYKNDGRVPDEELLWEIRLYEFILTQADPAAAAKAYLDTRYPDVGLPIFDKREVAAKLGWKIA